MPRSAFLGFLLQLAWAAPLFAQTSVLRAPTASADTAPTVLGPGDILKISVFRNPELSCECAIAADGSIVHPLYRDIKVAGIPIPEVEARLRSFLLKYESNPMLVIAPLMRVFVGGEVRQPNVYTVPPGTTLAEVIGLAGGPTDRASLDRVQVWRGSQRLTVNVISGNVADAQLPVHSGDQILIARSRSIFQDIVTPASSLIAAAAAVTTMIVQLRR